MAVDEHTQVQDAAHIHASSLGKSAAVAPEDPDVCWICLDDSGPLASACECPNRLCHPDCLARWQLQSAGSRRETHCDFCSAMLPDWRAALTPVTGADAPAVMNVTFDGVAYSFNVRPGPEGYEDFAAQVRVAFNLPDNSDLNITFTCDEPCRPGHQLTLQGAGAFDAAVHCASVSAARRQALSPGKSSSAASEAPQMSSCLPSVSGHNLLAPRQPVWVSGHHILAPRQGPAGRRDFDCLEVIPMPLRHSRHSSQARRGAGPSTLPQGLMEPPPTPESQTTQTIDEPAAAAAAGSSASAAAQAPDQSNKGKDRGCCNQLRLAFCHVFWPSAL